MATVREATRQMAAEAEVELRERIRETAALLRQLNQQYQDEYGAPPTPIRLDVPEGAQFTQDGEVQDRIAIERMDGEGLAGSYEDREPNAIYLNPGKDYDESQLSNLYGDGDQLH